MKTNLMICVAVCAMCSYAQAQTGRGAMAIIELKEKMATMEARMSQLESQLMIAMVRIKELEDAAKDNSEPIAQSHSDTESQSDIDQQDNATSSRGIVIRVDSVGQQDMARLQTKLQQRQSNLDHIREELRRANYELSDNQRKVRVWKRSYGRGEYVQEYINGEKAYIESTHKVRDWQAKEKLALQQVMRVQQEIARAGEKLIVWGATAEGKPVIATAQGPIVHMARSMKKGSWYRIGGPTYEASGTLKVKIVSAAMVDDPNES